MGKEVGQDTTWGKGASDLTPEGKSIDPKVGFILAASLPLSIIAFWKITLPLAYFTVSSILGAELIQKVTFLGQDIFSLMTSPCPPWISAEQRAFIDNQSFQQMQRIHDLTMEKFDDLVDVGEPFIISDALKAWDSTEDWNCLKFVERYPEAEFFNWQSHSEQPLGEILSRPGYQELDCVSGELNGESVTNRRYMKEVLGDTIAPPHFMESLTGFIGAKGTGLPPHVEESCNSFMIIQISGVTSWSFSHLVIENGEVKWSRPVRGFLQPGEAIVWFPSMKFHTEVVDGCSLSFRFGFLHSMPSKYLQEVGAILSSIADSDGAGRVRSKLVAAELGLVEECVLPNEKEQSEVR